MEIERLKHIFENHSMPFKTRKGISEDRLARLQRDLGYDFDENVCDFYRFSEGAGQNDHWFAAGHDEPQSLRLLTVDESAQSWFSLPLDEKYDQKLYQQLDHNFHDCEDEREAQIQAKRWMHRRWWPLANNGNTDSLMFDSDPAPGGRYGQIIAFYHDPDKIFLIADSFIEFFRDSNSMLETRWQEIHGDDEFDDDGDF